jgi:hypothetical protein
VARGVVEDAGAALAVAEPRPDVRQTQGLYPVEEVRCASDPGQGRRQNQRQGTCYLALEYCRCTCR